MLRSIRRNPRRSLRFTDSRHRNTPDTTVRCRRIRKSTAVLCGSYNIAVCVARYVFTLFTLNVLSLIGASDIGSITAFNAIEKLVGLFRIMNKDNANYLSDSVKGVLGLFVLICMVLCIMVIIWGVYFVRGITNISRDPVESLYCFKNVCLMNAIVNIGAFAVIIIWNLFVSMGSENFPQDSYFASYGVKLASMEAQPNIFIFGIAGIVGVTVILKLNKLVYKINKEQDKLSKYNNSTQESYWSCSSCGTYNRISNLYCVNCGKKKSKRRG